MPWINSGINMNKLKILITAAVFIISGFLIYYFRLAPGYGSYFTHFLYIPVILTAFWWQFWFIPVILLMVLIIVSVDFFFGHSPLIINDVIFFFIIGLTVSLLKKIQHNQLELKIYRDILYSIQEAVVIIDQSFNIILTNDSFDRIFCPPDERVGNIYLLLDGYIKTEEFHENALRSFCGEVVTMDFCYKGPSAGEGLYFSINFYPLKSEDGIENLILTFRDISEQKRSEMIQETAAERQRISIEVLELINRKKSDPDTIDRILALIRGKTGIDVIAVFLRSGDHFSKFTSGEFFRILSENNEIDPENIYNRIIDLDASLLKADFLNEILQDKIFWTNNLDEYRENTNDANDCIWDIKSFKSCAVIPLKNEVDVTGYFILLDRRRDFFDRELIAFYQGVVESIEIALNRIQYERNLENMVHEKELLLKEVHHRVKNNMQVIISLISLQASRQDDAGLRDALYECQNRVRTMALVHEKLYSSDNFTSININAYIRSLVPMLMNSYRIDKTKIYVDIDAMDMHFSLSVAIPLAQLVNEILSNAFKHAFNEGIDGEVSISLKPDHESGELYRLTISDNGSGLPVGVFYPQGNLGFQLIDALVKQIRGRITFVSNNGLTVDLFFGRG